MPPLLKGGQGRTSQSVRDDGSALVFTLLAILALVTAYVLRKVSP